MCVLVQDITFLCASERARAGTRARSRRTLSCIAKRMRRRIPELIATTFSVGKEQNKKKSDVPIKSAHLKGAQRRPLEVVGRAGKKSHTLNKRLRLPREEAHASICVTPTPWPPPLLKKDHTWGKLCNDFLGRVFLGSSFYFDDSVWTARYKS